MRSALIRPLVGGMNTARPAPQQFLPKPRPQLYLPAPTPMQVNEVPDTQRPESSQVAEGLWNFHAKLPSKDSPTGHAWATHMGVNKVVTRVEGGMVSNGELLPLFSSLSYLGEPVPTQTHVTKSTGDEAEKMHSGDENHVTIPMGRERPGERGVPDEGITSFDRYDRRTDCVNAALGFTEESPGVASTIFPIRPTVVGAVVSMAVRKHDPEAYDSIFRPDSLANRKS